MRWSIARMLSLMTVCAIALALYSRYWAPNQPVRLVMYAVYLALLSTASVVAFSSPPVWKRFWITYAVFGWIYFVFVLRIADPHTDRVIPLWFKTEDASVVGILCAFFCAFLSLVVPGPVKRATNGEDQQIEAKS
jgi:hypothetical protein